MEKKAGASVTGQGTSNIVPAPSLEEAVRMLSGGTVSIRSNASPYAELNARLRLAQNCGYEYCFYAVHYHREPFRYEVLRLPNMLCSPDYWIGFSRFLAMSENMCRNRMRLHEEILRSSTRHVSLPEVLLSDAYEAGPVSRVEVALQLSGQTDYDPGPVLHKYGIRAGELLMGVRAYINHAPNIKQALKGKSNVAGQLFPGCGR